MDFVTAEEKFQELQARIRRGEAMSEDQYQEELAKLMVQDEAGVFWSLEPGTGRWLYFNGTEWVLGTPPPPSAPAPVMPPRASPVPDLSQPMEPAGYPTPIAEQGPSAEAPSYYVPSDLTRPPDYTGQYTGTPSYSSDYNAPSSYQAPMSTTPPMMEPEGMPAYVRMPEPDLNAGPSGGIPPRPVREASPLAVPGGERAWLPFALGALVLLLCAVVLFFGVRGLPQFSGATNTEIAQQPTDEANNDVLPTETVEFAPTDAPQPTAEPTQEPQPTAAPEPVKATTTDLLNIRAGPARTTASVGKLPTGTEVVVVGKNTDGTWLQIQIPEKTDLGWISAEFVTVSGDLGTLPVVPEDGGTAAPQPTETPTG